MSSGLRGTNPLNIFRWKRSSESYLTTGLLNDVPPEVELSDYGRVPSPGSESPSGLLHGETLKVELVTDLDLFFERLYSYYCEKGLWCIIVKWIVELLSLVFTICFSAFFLLYVDWNGLRNAKCGMDAVESGTGPCDLANEALHHHPLTPFTLHKAIILGYLGIFSVYSILCFLRFFAQLRHTLKIRHFYRNSLHVTDSELQTLQWATVLEKVVKVQTTEQLCVVKDLSAHEIVMRLMRKENYLIGMINKGVLAFPIAKCIPGAGPTVKFGSNGKQQRLILTKTLEWTLNWCILQSMFDRNFCIRRDFISNPDALKKRLLVVGVVMLLLSPFLVIFMLVYLFLRHAEQFYKHPTSVSSRRWSNLSRWVLRELNEVDHLFKHRINSSAIHASDYLKQFPSPIISIIAKFISFISGGFAAVLIIIALLDESLLEGHIYGRNLWWYAAVFGTITAISRAAVTDEVLVLDPEREMSLVVQHTHYLPKRWRGKVNTEKVRKEFETLFQYTTMMWLEEMASIFLTPYLLIFVVPKRVDDILQFITDFTVNVEGVGHVCSFSVFDFQNHGNSNYGSPCNTDRFKRSSQGKMEKSFLSFQSSYLFWEPDSQGAQFLLTLRKFRDQQLRGTIDGYACSTSPQRMWQWSPNRRDSQYTLTSQSARDQPLSGHHLSSMWLIETNPRTHPYLLDWYYTSRPQNGHLNPASAPREVTRNIPGDQPNQREYWMPQPQFHGDDRIHEPMWVNNDTTNSDFQARSSSHLEASTSTPFFQEPSGSVLFQHPAKSQWWLRGSPGRDPQGSNPQASFLEPPQFNTYHSGDHYSDIHSERSSEVEERDGFHWGLHNSLSQTTYTHDLPSAGEFRLHFDDVYRPTTEGESHSVGPEFTGSFEPYSVEPELTRSYDPPSMVPERTRSFDPPSMEQERARSFEPRSMEPALNRSFDPQPDLSRSFG